MSFDQKQTQLGCRSFSSPVYQGFPTLGGEWEFLAINMCSGSKKTTEPELDVGNLPRTAIRAGWRSNTHQNTRQKLRDSATNDK